MGAGLLAGAAAVGVSVGKGMGVSVGKGSGVSVGASSSVGARVSVGSGVGVAVDSSVTVGKSTGGRVGKGVSVMARMVAVVAVGPGVLTTKGRAGAWRAVVVGWDGGAKRLSTIHAPSKINKPRQPVRHFLDVRFM